MLSQHVYGLVSIIVSKKCMIIMELLALFLSVLCPTLISAQSEGDVRLVGADYANKGRLEIYWQGKWGTFCSISQGGAEAACKQMGFSDFVSYASYTNRQSLLFNVSKASEDTPIAIANTYYCSGVFDKPHHILRCPFSSDIPKSCSHDNDVILYCLPSSVWLHPYQTEVRLNSSTYLSTGTLEIYISGEWGNVCGQFDQRAADSACRQMGYTGATTFSNSSKATTQTTWLNGVSCNSRSCSCLNGCFGNAPTTPTTSCGNSNYVNVTCTFDVKVANSNTAGNYNDCPNYQSTCGHASEAGVIAAVVVVLVAVVIIGGITATGIIYYVIVVKRKRGYYSINTD